MSFETLDIYSWLDKRDKFDLLIDARSPKEYDYSNIYRSLNFYALDDLQHSEVGTIYKQSKSSAKILGAKYICENLSNHLPLIADRSKVGSCVGIYCARGGMRSEAIGTVLGMSGYRVLKLEGGYKAYRNAVQSYFDKPLDIKFITLFGNTGSCKTRLINALSPSINLENIANHLGSVFGSVNGKQPSQKYFEDTLFEKLTLLDGMACFIEGESRRIGSLTLPACIYEAMGQGIGVHVVSSLEKRIECIMADYGKISSDFFYSCIKKITPFISTEARNDVVKFFEKGELEKVCEILLVKYYDKVYKKPRKIDFTINADNFMNAKAELEAIYNSICKL